MWFHQSSVSFLRRPKLRLDYKRYEIFSETGSFSFSLLLVTGVLHRNVYGTARKQVKDTRPYKDCSLIILFLFSLFLNSMKSKQQCVSFVSILTIYIKAYPHTFLILFMEIYNQSIYNRRHTFERVSTSI